MNETDTDSNQHRHRTTTLSRRAALRAGAGVLAGLPFISMAAGAPVTAIESGQTYRIESVHSGKVLDVEDWSTANGANIQQWDYSGGANQHWRVESVGGGAYRLISAHSGKVIDIEGGSLANGANVQQWDWHGGDNQRFYIDHRGNGEFFIMPLHSEKVLDVEDWSTANGGNIQQWLWYNTANQRWRFHPVEGGGEGGGGGSGGRLPYNVFAPYDLYSVNTGTTFVEHSGEAWTPFFTAAFVLAGTDGSPMWDGWKPVGRAGMNWRIDNLRNRGGEAIISFGGAAGDYLAHTSGSVGELYNHYRYVVEHLDAKHLDFDVERENGAAVGRRNEALVWLQDSHDVSVSFTLATGTQGLPGHEKWIVQNAHDWGVDIDYVNIMTMNYGWVPPSFTNIKSSAESLHRQLEDIYPGKSDYERWRMVGLTPMIGRQNTGEVFWHSDARQVVQFAQDKDIRYLSFWSIDRDKGDCGISSGPYEYSHIFSGFNS